MPLILKKFGQIYKTLPAFETSATFFHKNTAQTIEKKPKSIFNSYNKNNLKP